MHKASMQLKSLLAASSFAFALWLTGCGGGTFTSTISTPTPTPTPTPTVDCPAPPAAVPLPTPPSPTPVAGNSFTASVLAGGMPVVGASVQLYAAGTGGNGSAATALLNAPLLTDSRGSITVPAQYTCPGAAADLYLLSQGGHVGAGAGSNASLVLVSALGACNTVATGTKFVANEPTTVAAAYALAPFAAGSAAGTAIGASATNTTGLNNAFLTAAELANPLAGSTPGATLPANVVLSPGRIASLSNAVNACATSSASCASLFAATTLPGSTAPTNTFDALVGTVRNPANQVAALYGVSQLSSAYPGALAAAPTDWTLFLTISGAGMNGPSGLGVDSTGSVWVASYFYTAAKFTPLGAPVFPSGITANGLNNSYGLAMDASDNAWIPNEQPPYGVSTGSVSKLSPAGASLAGSNGFMSGGLNYPISVAISPDTTAWVVDYANSYLTLLNASGTPLSGTSGYTSDLFSFPAAVVVDGNGYGWVANQTGSNVTRVKADGSSFVNFNCCDASSGLAVDQANNIWVANYYGNSVSLITNTCTIASTGYTGGGGINHPQSVAVDGAGNVWVANFRAPYLSELTGTQSGSPGTAVSPATGYGADAALLEAFTLAIDASGGIWVTNFGSNTLTRFVGLATPVRTPLSGIVEQP